MQHRDPEDIVSNHRQQSRDQFQYAQQLQSGQDEPHHQSTYSGQTNQMAAIYSYQQQQHHEATPYANYDLHLMNDPSPVYRRNSTPIQTSLHQNRYAPYTLGQRSNSLVAMSPSSAGGNGPPGSASIVQNQAQTNYYRDELARAPFSTASSSLPSSLTSASSSLPPSTHQPQSSLPPLDHTSPPSSASSLSPQSIPAYQSLQISNTSPVFPAQAHLPVPAGVYQSVQPPYPPQVYSTSGLAGPTPIGVVTTQSALGHHHPTYGTPDHSLKDERRKRNKESSQRFRDRTKERAKEMKDRMDYLEKRVKELEEYERIVKSSPIEDLQQQVQRLGGENAGLKEKLHQYEAEIRLLRGQDSQESSQYHNQSQPSSNPGELGNSVYRYPERSSDEEKSKPTTSRSPP